METQSLPSLRPLRLGELLDQAIRLYRRNFLTFIGIIAAGVRSPDDIADCLHHHFEQFTEQCGTVQFPGGDILELCLLGWNALDPCGRFFTVHFRFRDRDRSINACRGR